jgi:hypothetical protein
MIRHTGLVRRRHERVRRVPMTPQHVQEALCRAYVLAVAAHAGILCRIKGEFDYGLDGEFRNVVIRKEPAGNNRYLETGRAVDFQMKASKNWELKNNSIVYDLEAKTFRDLAFQNAAMEKEGSSPSILILLCLPTDASTWLTVSGEQLLLKKSCYWHWVPGTAVSDNSATTRIVIPDSNVLTQSALEELLKKARTGAFP